LASRLGILVAITITAASKGDTKCYFVLCW